MTTGNLLLRQLATKFDLPLAASFWAVASGILLMFFLGGALGAVAVTQGLEANEIILTFVVLSALCLVTLAASLLLGGCRRTPAGHRRDVSIVPRRPGRYLSLQQPGG